MSDRLLSVMSRSLDIPALIAALVTAWAIVILTAVLYLWCSRKD